MRQLLKKWKEIKTSCKQILVQIKIQNQTHLFETQRAFILFPWIRPIAINFGGNYLLSWIFTLVVRHPWKFFSVEQLSRFVNNLLCSDKVPECWVLPIKNWIEAIYRWLITPVEIMTPADLKSQQIICLEEFGDLYGHRNISCHFAMVSATLLSRPSPIIWQTCGIVWRSSLH